MKAGDFSAQTEEGFGRFLASNPSVLDMSKVNALKLTWLNGVGWGMNQAKDSLLNSLAERQEAAQGTADAIIDSGDLKTGYLDPGDA